MHDTQRIGQMAATSRPVITISPESTVLDAAHVMRNHDVGCLLVTDDRGDVAGILSERDIVAKVVAQSADPCAVRVRQVMTADVITCTPWTTIEQAQQLMAQHRVRRLPVVDGGRPVAMLSAEDVLSHQLLTTTVTLLERSEVLELLEKPEAPTGEMSPAMAAGFVA